MSTKTEQTAAQKTAKILINHGYHCIRGEKIEGSRLEWWAGKKGVIILQFWDDGGDGVASYCGWSLGHTFDELKAALNE